MQIPPEIRLSTTGHRVAVTTPPSGRGNRHGLDPLTLSVRVVSVESSVLSKNVYCPEQTPDIVAKVDRMKAEGCVKNPPHNPELSARSLTACCLFFACIPSLNQRQLS